MRWLAAATTLLVLTACTPSPTQAELRAASDASYDHTTSLADEWVDHARATFPDREFELNYYPLDDDWFQCGWTPTRYDEAPESVHWDAIRQLIVQDDQPTIDLVDAYIQHYLDDGAVITRDNRDDQTLPTLRLAYQHTEIAVIGTTQTMLDNGTINSLDIRVSAACLTPPDDIRDYNREHPEDYFTTAPALTTGTGG